jgi:hypothetical protein
MTIPNPEHLFQQAERLAAPASAGPPRQTDLRRAISSAYYGLFHFILTCLADDMVGAIQRGTGRYALVYRSIDHRALRDLCVEAQKSTPSKKFSSIMPELGFGLDIQIFAAKTHELYESRNRADYDPQPRFVASDAKLAIDAARTARLHFTQADPGLKTLFLTLLLCPPR